MKRFGPLSRRLRHQIRSGNGGGQELTIQNCFQRHRMSSVKLGSSMDRRLEFLLSVDGEKGCRIG